MLQLYNNDLDPLSIFAYMPTSLLQFHLKRSHFFILWLYPLVSQTQASLLGILIAYVNTFCFTKIVVFCLQ